MKLITIILAVTASFSFAGEWIKMFDGKTLKGWKVNSENPKTFSVEDGAIKVEGPRAHLFYGTDGNAKFKNFEFECEVKTAKNANAGIFIHTKFQDKGWPSQGYECQVKVEGKKVTVTINGKVTNEYTEPTDHKEKTKRLSKGTIGLQGHDPGSLIYFRKLRIKKLD
jgi:hypothetical protein